MAMDENLNLAAAQMIDLAVRGMVSVVELQRSERYMIIGNDDLPEMVEKIVLYEREMTSDEKSVVLRQANRIFEEGFTKVYERIAGLLDAEIPNELIDAQYHGPDINVSQLVLDCSREEKPWPHFTFQNNKEIV